MPSISFVEKLVKYQTLKLSNGCFLLHILSYGFCCTYRSKEELISMIANLLSLTSSSSAAAAAATAYIHMIGDRGLKNSIYRPGHVPCTRLHWNKLRLFMRAASSSTYNKFRETAKDYTIQIYRCSRSKWKYNKHAVLI